MSIAVREDLVFFFFASVVVHKIKGTTVPDEGACYFMMYRTPQSLPHTLRERERRGGGGGDGRASWRRPAPVRNITTNRGRREGWVRSPKLLLKSTSKIRPNN